MNFIISPHNEEAYRKAQQSLREKNITAIVHPMLSNIGEIGIKFLGETEGRTLCVEGKIRRIYGGIKSLIKRSKIDQEKRFGEIEYETYTNLIKRIKEGQNIGGYENILLVDLEYCGENEWKEGISSLISENQTAKILELVQYSTMDLSIDETTFRNIRGHISSFISEEKGTRMGICCPIYINQTASVETRLQRYIKRINSLEDKELQESLQQKVSLIRKLNEKINSIFPKPDGDLDDLLYGEGNSETNDVIGDEEFEKNVSIDLQILKLRNTVRELLRQIAEGLGDKVEKSELETLREENEELRRKEETARELLDGIESTNCIENDENER